MGARFEEGVSLTPVKWFRQKPALRGLLLSCAVSFATGTMAQAACANDALRDFDFLLDTVEKQYAYFDEEGMAARWQCVRTQFRPEAERATRETLLPILERALDALTDFHAHMNTNTAASWRLVPSGTDIRARWEGERAIVEQVRPRSPAMRMGVRADDEIVRINDIPAAQFVANSAPICVPSALPAAQYWALQRALAGKHDTPRQLTVKRRDDTLRTLWLSAPQVEKLRNSVQKLSDGTVVIPITDLGNPASAKRFAAQLARHRDASAFIIDLRETANGGNTDVAEPILGRFIERSAAYQRVIPRDGTPTDRIVLPSGAFTVSQPLAVVVGAWTASMGEGVAIGLNALRGAPIVGAPMAGLRGAVERFTLPASGWQFSLPTQRLNHVNGASREAYVPISANKNEYGTDLIYAAAQRALAAQRAAGGFIAK
jgi:carboxyl-terminal processing protease